MSIPTSRRHWVRAAIVFVGAVVALTGSLMTWLRSGAAGRSSYDLFDLVDRLGYSPSGAVGWALRLWPLFPLLLAISVVLQWVALPNRWHWAQYSVPVVAAVYGAAVALAVTRAPDDGLILNGAGPWVTVVGAAALVAGVLIPPTRHARSARP